jgi:hypothetical protein
MLVDLEGRLFSGAVLQQEVGAGRKQVLVFVPVAGDKIRILPAHVFRARVDGVYLHAVGESIALAWLEPEIELNGILDQWRHRSVRFPESFP